MSAAEIVLHLGGSQPDSPSVGNARHWAFMHADGTNGSAVPPALREALLEATHASFMLADFTSKQILHEIVTPVDDELLANGVRIAEFAAAWPAQRVIEEQHDLECAPVELATTLRRFPTIGFWHVMMRKWRSLWGSAPSARLDASGAWNIGVLHQPVHVLLQEDGSRNVRWLPNPSKGRSRMEPFGYFDAEGDLNALFRKSAEDGSEGLIARVRPKVDNILKRSRPMLEREAEAAFPFVAQIDGRPCAVISDLEKSEVRIMPIHNDNSGLEEGRVILSEALHAPSLFQHADLWWLFGTRSPWPEARLHGYHAGTPHGPFVEHACSPMKCDARNSRPAGTPFVHEGVLYRPALDATDPIHLAVWLNRVDLLTPIAFRETPVRRIDGFPATAYGKGVRTISSIGEVTLVDGLRSPVLDGVRANASRGKSKSKKRRSR
ncbi:MAG: hypothetical protein IPJ85_05585 [Flavobacteriales bacterium]|nr:hypothetical protein [Flavobacteriales bacterium]